MAVSSKHYQLLIIIPLTTTNGVSKWIMIQIIKIYCGAKYVRLIVGALVVPLPIFPGCGYEDTKIIVTNFTSISIMVTFKNITVIEI